MASQPTARGCLRLLPCEVWSAHADTYAPIPPQISHLRKPHRTERRAGQLHTASIQVFLLHIHPKKLVALWRYLCRCVHDIYAPSESEKFNMLVGKSSSLIFHLFFLKLCVLWSFGDVSIFLLPFLVFNANSLVALLLSLIHI